MSESRFHCTRCKHRTRHKEEKGALVCKNKKCNFASPKVEGLMSRGSSGSFEYKEKGLIG